MGVAVKLIHWTKRATRPGTYYEGLPEQQVAIDSSLSFTRTYLCELLRASCLMLEMNLDVMRRK